MKKRTRTWHFEFWVAKNPPPDEKLARTWDFEFWVAQITPPPRGLEFECVETNRCIPQRYRLVCEVMTRTFLLIRWNENCGVPPRDTISFSCRYSGATRSWAGRPLSPNAPPYCRTTAVTIALKKFNQTRFTSPPLKQHFKMYFTHYM